MMVMNENNGKKATSLAITEKQSGHHRSSRPGGCVGIFFQLFDWNRRLAKKKLFPKKLLSLPVRAKQASKRFGASDKLPAATKLHMIADENRGGFPSARHCGIDGVGAKQKHEMRPAGLVAKLMGLESMPEVHRIKLMNTLGSDTFNSKDKKFVGEPSECVNEETNLDKAQMKLEISRPHKLQKTGQLDGQTVARFGAEALQFRNVISRSRRKQHGQPKLASPLKGPKVFSARKNTSRWIDVATKILEPGLQAKSRPKYILTYSNLMPRSLEGISGVSYEVPNQFEGYANTNANSSCRSCGNPLDNLASRSSMEEYLAGEACSASNQVNVTSQGSGRSMSNPPLSSSLQQDRDELLEHAHDQTADYGAQNLIYHQACSEPQRVDIHSTKDGDEKWHKSTGLPKPHRASLVATIHKPPIQATNHISQGKERILPRSKCSNSQSRRDTEALSRVNGSKDFVALNRSLSGRTRLRMQNNVGSSSRSVTDRKCYNEKSDSSQQMRTPPRKRRTTTSYGPIQRTNSIDTPVGKHGDNRPGIFSGKRIELNDRPLKQTCDRIRSTTTQGSGNNVTSNKNMDVISFSFNSPLKHKTEMLSAENEGKISSQKPFLIGGDTLGALLEQKLHELACQREDELAAGDTLPNKTTAMILQELMSALISNNPTYDNENVGKRLNRDFRNAVQVKKKSAQSSVHSYSADPFSPGSVLEASFSNSSSSSCLDDCLGHKTFLDSADYACDSQQALESNGELWSSAASMDKRITESAIMLRLVNYTSNLLNNIDRFGSRLSGSKLIHVKDILLNAELFCRTGMAHSSDEIEESIIDHLLLYELEDLASAMRKKSMCLSGLEESDKQGKQLKVFLFDSVIEYLDLCGSFYNFGLKGWGRIPLFLDAKFLMESIDKEIRKWADLAGKLPDEVIEWEMSHSLAKWTNFEIEALETGIEIESDLFRSLVDEIVTDICESSVGSIQILM